MNTKMLRRPLWTFCLVLLAICLCFAGCDGGAGEPETTASEVSAAPETTETVTEPPTVAETEPEPVVYYVCNKSEDPIGTATKSFDSLSRAINYCNRVKQEGYRVVSSEGEVCYLPYTELQCDILRECKYVTDFVRERKFTYGNAPINPAISWRDRLVSCDRFACWALYNVGFTDQPRQTGVVVSVLHTWCEANGFERIDREEDLQPGDVVLVNFNGSYALHTFIHAGSVGRSGAPYYRYDCGSNARIQSVQPSKEPIYQFWRAYRPVKPVEAETGN